MIENPRVGDVVRYIPVKGATSDVRVKGFRKGFVETAGITDGRHRSISRKQLHEI